MFNLFGFISQLQQGRWFIEDLDADVELDFTDTTNLDDILGPGLFVETCLVIVQGVYLGNKLFRVTQMLMPPVERRVDTL
jgi:DNA polymerase epsilon subunit 2